jgi:hypothetical protein
MDCQSEPTRTDSSRHHSRQFVVEEAVSLSLPAGFCKTVIVSISSLTIPAASRIAPEFSCVVG